MMVQEFSEIVIQKYFDSFATLFIYFSLVFVTACAVKCVIIIAIIMVLYLNWSSNQ